MDRVWIRRTILGIALCGATALLVGQAFVAQEPAAPAQSLTKPLNAFSLGDIFPKVVTDAFAETGKKWASGADEFIRAANTRKQNVDAALKAKEAEIPNLKNQLSQAKKENDLVKIGTLEGTIANEQNIMKVLKGLLAVSDKQIAMANKWKSAGGSMEKFTAADASFDALRTKKISRPAPGEPDQRLDAAGVATFKAHSQALEDLGKAFSDLGAQTQAMAADRLKIISTLEKGGNIQTTK